MTEQQINECIIIMLFDGYKRTGHVFSHAKYGITTLRGGIEQGYIRYHFSWNWLLPVWKRFLTEADELLDKDDAYRSDVYRIFNNCVAGNNIEAAAKHMADAILWYKSQDKTEKEFYFPHGEDYESEASQLEKDVREIAEHAKKDSAVSLLKKKYTAYVSNIEWHIKTNKPVGADLEQCNTRLKDYKEVLNDLNKLF